MTNIAERLLSFGGAVFLIPDWTRRSGVSTPIGVLLLQKAFEKVF
jgi:hypothetical protein